MNVVFLALGATRRGAVIAEARHVLAEGGTVTVLIRKPSSWEKHPLPEGVKVVEMAALERGHRPAWVRLTVYRVPRLLLRLCLLGPLSGRQEQFDNAYLRRIARPVDRRLARLYRSDPARIRRRVLDRGLLRAEHVDLVIVGDAQSLVTASELADAVTDAGACLAYTIDREHAPASHARGTS